ncbi:hypothetical protein COSHB9_01470 [Companilactobacillus alimentarius]
METLKSKKARPENRSAYIFRSFQNYFAEAYYNHYESIQDKPDNEDLLAFWLNTVKLSDIKLLNHTSILFMRRIEPL